MKSLGRAVAIGLLALSLVVAVLLASAWATLPLDGITVSVHGESYSLADLHGPRAVLVFLVAVLVIVFAIVAALVMGLVGMTFGALGLAFGLVMVASSLALVITPFALIGWLLWRHFGQRQVATVVAARP